MTIFNGGKVMKNKILTFIIGVLVGAIITTVCFYAYMKTNNTRMMDMSGRGEMPPMMQQGDGETPPEKPSEEAPTGGTISEIPSENTTN